VCRDEIPKALEVPDQARVDGRRVLVYDDVFTDGLNLNTVARKLREAGAAQVCGVTLARQPWRG
jgi:predicted amidophosphoribosyltransferase